MERAYKHHKDRTMVTIEPKTPAMQLVSCLGPEELAELTVRMALDSTERTNMIMARVETLPYSNVTAYVRQFNIAASKANLTVLPNADVRDSILAVFLGRLERYYTYFPPELWGEWFDGYLPLFLPGINETHISRLSIDISCNSYQSVLRGFNQAYQYLPHETTLSFYNTYIKSFLNNKVFTQDVCNYTGPMDWVRENLGSFTNQATFQDLLVFEWNLGKVVDNSFLTTKEQADFTIISDSLCNVTLLNTVFTKVTGLGSYEALWQYLVYLQDNLAQHIISKSQLNSSLFIN
ncbi:uncharacterized protein LOC142098478 [Mixophyes fleayi]|uniref:uncharacterized protein LOC142098478 n=1 Tax=Mixophyes fleayi TaxID=3061075 RepID=UPI003F4E3E55